MTEGCERCLAGPVFDLQIDGLQCYLHHRPLVPERRGSSTSRSASPNNVKPSVVNARVKPDQRIGHCDSKIWLKPSERIAPQEGEGGGSPIPMKDKPASKVMTQGRSIAASSSAGAITFGRMWENRIARFRAPSERSASTYAFSRME